MTKFQKLLSLLLCLCMLMSAAALAEDAAQPETVAELPNDTVLATINGENITYGDITSAYESLVSQYGSYYDMTLQENIDLFRAVALENKLSETVMMLKGKEMGLDQLTDEEAASLENEADTNWQNALDSYISQFYPDMTDESSEEDKAAAKKAAEDYFGEMGYTNEILRENYKMYAAYDKIQAYIVQDITVTDEEIEAAYQELVEADKALYENDLDAYLSYNNYVDMMAYYSSMNGSASDMDHAWYKPAGFRAVKHILLPVDETLMKTYTDLQARYEEQLEAEAAAAEAADATTAPETEPTAAPDPAAEPTAEPTPTPEPVTEDQIQAAREAILASLSDTIEQINKKITEGVDFDELIAAYAVDTNGKATDQGMLTEPYKTSGYEVASASTNYVKPFVDAAFSVENIGDVSLPYISDYGVHIVKYIGDVEPGPIAMTDAQKEAKRSSLLATRQSEKMNVTIGEWLEAADIVYTGAVKSLNEIEAAQAAQSEDSAATEETADDTTNP